MSTETCRHGRIRGFVIYSGDEPVETGTACADCGAHLTRGPAAKAHHPEETDRVDARNCLQELGRRGLLEDPPDPWEAWRRRVTERERKKAEELRRCR